MKRIIYTLLILLSAVSMYGNEFRVVGYLPSYRWSAVNSLDYDLLTHVCYSFANPDASGNFSYSQDISNLLTKAHAKNCKVFASIGGGGPGTDITNAYKELTKSANRTAFVSKLMDYLRASGVDGVDVDLEGTLVEMSTYDDFVVELADSVHAQGLEISAALALWTSYSIDNSTVDAIDFVNVMSYDQTGSWSSEGPHSTYSAAVSDFNYWTGTKAQAADKIVLGLPFYGYEFLTAGGTKAWTWCQIVYKFPSKLDVDELTTTTGNLYYNGTATIQKKTQFMKDKNGGGVMIWELGQDCFGTNSLMEIIKTTMDGTIGQEELSVNNEVNIYPNPTQDVLNINKQVDNYRILSVTGELLLKGRNTNQINVGSLVSGTYFIVFNTDNDIKPTVFIKK